MTLLPVVERELRVAARQPKTYANRLLVALVAVALFGWAQWEFGRHFSVERLGRVIFQALSTFAFAYCLLTSVRLTADCLSEEKREGTLGLLFLTDLKGYDVVLGKLGSTSLNAFFGLLAVFPVMTLPLLLGGVTWANVGWVALALLNTLFFGLAVGMWVSVRSWAARKALLGTVLLVALLTGGGPWLVETWHWRPPNPGFYCLMLSSPLCTFLIALNHKMSVKELLSSLAIVHLLGWGFLLAACRQAPRAWQDRPASARQLRWRERLQLWSLGKASARRQYRARLLDLNPLFWLDDRYRLQKTLLWAGLLGFITFWFWQFSHHLDQWLSDDVIIPSGLVLNTALVVWIAFQAPHRFAEDRASGALELLLATPLEVKDLLRGRWLALRRQFGWAVLCVVSFDTLMAVAYFTLAYNIWQIQWRVCLLLLCGAGIVLFALNAWTAGWFGMWQGLRAKNSLRASLATLWWVLVLPWLVFVILLPVTTLLDRIRLIQLRDEHIVLLWFSTGVAINGFLLMRARLSLARRFREAATRPPDARRAWGKPA